MFTLAVLVFGLVNLIFCVLVVNADLKRDFGNDYRKWNNMSKMYLFGFMSWPIILTVMIYDSLTNAPKEQGSTD